MDSITLKSSHLYIPGEIATKVFGDDPQAYLAYQAERGTLLVAPVSQQWFYKMHKPSQHLLKTRNLQGDKTIALHEILIDNALDALEEGTPSGAPPQITIRTCQKAGNIIVEIEDNGPGIPAEVKNRILEPFFTTKQMGKGSGLGLDVVRRIVQNRHKGNLLVSSAPGRTCFSVLLPAAG